MCICKCVRCTCMYQNIYREERTRHDITIPGEEIIWLRCMYMYIHICKCVWCTCMFQNIYREERTRHDITIPGEEIIWFDMPKQREKGHVRVSPQFQTLLNECLYSAYIRSQYKYMYLYVQYIHIYTVYINMYILHILQICVYVYVCIKEHVHVVSQFQTRIYVCIHIQWRCIYPVHACTCISLYVYTYL